MGGTDEGEGKHHKGSSSEAKDKIGGPGAHGGRLKSGKARRTEAVAMLQMEARSRRRLGCGKETFTRR